MIPTGASFRFELDKQTAETFPKYYLPETVKKLCLADSQRSGVVEVLL